MGTPYLTLNKKGTPPDRKMVGDILKAPVKRKKYSCGKKRREGQVLAMQ